MFGEGVFEIIVKYFVFVDKFVISEWEISRINKYGSVVNCVYNDVFYFW